jgi:hypothetical protein
VYVSQYESNDALYAAIFDYQAFKAECQDWNKRPYTYASNIWERTLLYEYTKININFFDTGCREAYIWQDYLVLLDFFGNLLVFTLPDMKLFRSKTDASSNGGSFSWRNYVYVSNYSSAGYVYDWLNDLSMGFSAPPPETGGGSPILSR